MRRVLRYTDGEDPSSLDTVFRKTVNVEALNNVAGCRLVLLRKCCREGRTRALAVGGGRIRTRRAGRYTPSDFFVVVGYWNPRSTLFALSWSGFLLFRQKIRWLTPTLHMVGRKNRSISNVAQNWAYRVEKRWTPCGIWCIVQSLYGPGFLLPHRSRSFVGVSI